MSNEFNTLGHYDPISHRKCVDPVDALLAAEKGHKVYAYAPGLWTEVNFIGEYQRLTGTNIFYVDCENNTNPVQPDYNDLGHVDPDFGRICIPADVAWALHVSKGAKIFRFVFDKNPGFGGEWQADPDFRFQTKEQLEKLGPLYAEQSPEESASVQAATLPDPFKGMPVIHKYVLRVMDGENHLDIALKGHGYLLKVAQQRSTTCVWAIEYPESPVVQNVRVWWFGTGHTMPENANAFVHLGTELYFQGDLVLHFFAEHLPS